jgi:putative flippase GtrA
MSLVHGVGMYDMLANCIGIVGGTVVNYLMNSRITWGAGKKGGQFPADNRSVR